ncbi:MAG: globin domain-containing protein [Alphaproteobacteria bacterium]|nr:globin domain-containing protein [Alphaproteobacteria bacterium]
MDYIAEARLAEIIDVTPMTPEQIDQVRESFASIRFDLEGFAEVFYMQLFERCPEIQYMYRGDQKEQERKLASMLVWLIDGLDRMDDVKPMLQSLGCRHIAFGVRSKDYGAFGEVLMWTVAKFLDRAFTPEVAESWRSFYEEISAIMQSHADHDDRIESHVLA